MSIGIYNSPNLTVVGTLVNSVGTCKERTCEVPGDPKGAEYCSEKARWARGADHTNDLKVINANLRRHVP